MKHNETYNKNIDEINRLLTIHYKLKHQSSFRRHLEVLNKSGIVLLVACWEAFIEDLALHSFDFMLSHATNHKIFPAKVLTQASKTFWESKDEREIWKLADDGWKAILISRKDEILKEFVESFHTPRATQIDKLFESLIGLNSLSSYWRWKGMSSEQARKKLGELVTLRGSIAHRVAASKSVTRRSFFDNGVFVARLGVVSSNAVRSFIHSRTSEYPWIEVELGDY